MRLALRYVALQEGAGKGAGSWFSPDIPQISICFLPDHDVVLNLSGRIASGAT